MNIYAKAGHKVKFLNKNGYDHEPKTASEVLNTETIYEVDYTEVGSWITYVKLKDIDGMFNSVMFEDVE